MKQLYGSTAFMLFELIICTHLGNNLTAKNVNDADALFTFIKSQNWGSVIVITDGDFHTIGRQLTKFYIVAEVITISHLENKNLSFTMGIYENTTGCLQGQMVVWCGKYCRQQVFTWASANGLFQKRCIWIFVQEDDSNNFEFLAALSSLRPLHPSSVVYVFTPLHARQNTFVDTENVYNLFKVLPSLPEYNLELLGIFRSSRWYANIRRKHNLPLQGYTLKVGIMHMPPLAIVMQKENTTVFGGFFVHLMSLFSQYLGFSYEFVIDETQSYGVFRNGTWSGLIGMLHRQEVDISGLTLALTLQRMEAADYSPYFDDISCVVVIRKPSTIVEYKFSTYVESFPLNAWIAIIAMGIVTCICLLCSNYRRTTLLYPGSYLDVIWTVVYMYTQMDAIIIQHWRPSQVILLSFLLFILIASSSYNTSLTALLTMKKPPLIFNDIEELLDDGSYGVSIIPSAAPCEAFKKAKSGTYAKLWSKMQKKVGSFVKSNEEGLNKAYNEKFSYIMASTQSKHTLRANCSFTSLKNNFHKSSVHLVLQKNSPFREIISLKMLSLRLSGVLKTLDSRFSPNYYVPECPKEEAVSTVGLHGAIGAFAVLGSGYLIALVAFCVENLITPYCVKHSENQPSYNGMQPQ